jgi:polysaccharide biosynthesis/export protein ExoF
MRFLIVLATLFLLSPAQAQEADYRLKVGDLVEIWVAQDPDLNRQVVIAPDGRMSLPLAGHLHAEGLTLEELETELKARLQSNYKDELNLTAILASGSGQQAQRNTVFVVGDVSKPGEYSIRPGMTVLHVVTLAGGLLRPAQTSVGGDADLSPQERLAKLQVKAARLQAELDGRTKFSVPSDISDAVDSAFLADLVRQENLALDARRDNNLATDQQQERAKSALEASLSSLHAQLELNQQQLDLAKQELDDVHGLVEKGLAASSRETGLRRSLAGVEGQREQLSASLAQADINLQNLEASGRSTRDQRRYALLAEIETNRQQVRVLRARIDSGSSDASRDSLYAFTILREKTGGMEEISANELSPVEAGDLVKVSAKFEVNAPASAPTGDETQTSLKPPVDKSATDAAKNVFLGAEWGSDPTTTPFAADDGSSDGSGSSAQ